MPAPLKEALVRETARRGTNVNDLAAGILAEQFGVPFTPTGRRRKVLAGSSPVLLLRVPEELKDEIHAEASRRDTNANDVILAALTDGLGIPPVSNRKDTMAETNGQERTARAEGQGARRDHRRRQLRQLPPPGRRVLQGRQGRSVRPGPHARRPRRLSHLGHRVHRRLRRRQGQGRRRPRRRDLGASERHDQVRQRSEDRDQGLARHDARRDRQVPRTGRREGARPDRRRRSASSGRPAPTSSSTTSPSAPRQRRSGTPRRSSRPAARW